MMNKEIKKLNTSLKSIKNTEMQNLRARERKERGIVRSVSPQGDRLYLLVQRPSSQVFNNDTQEFETLDGVYFGNEQGLESDEITMAEVLVEADVDLSLIKYDPSHWIGKEVIVIMVDKRPVLVLLQSPLLNPRTISAEDIKIARVLSPSKKLNSKESIEYLQSLGYTRAEVQATIAETMKKIEPKGHVLRYGASTTWHDASIPKGTDSKNLEDSTEDGIVTHLYGGTLSDKYCYQPAKALSAR